MTAPRVHGLLCVRNEADRYLKTCIEWNKTFLDTLFVYDDQSTDDTAEIARSLGAWVETRPDNRLSFLEHEGEFRQASWEAFEIAMNPDVGDWVLAFDADEFLIGPRGLDAGWLLRHTAASLAVNHSLGCRLVIREVFGIDEASGAPLVRTDGFWGGITGLRLFQYRTGGRFTNRKLGCGSTPFYVEPIEDSSLLELLHFGYARQEDRIAKHDRYFDQPGHNKTHIDSILGEPVLVPWQGEVPF